MNRPKVLLQQLLKDVRTWEVRIKKTTLSDDVTFIPDPATGEFTIRVSWKNNDGSPGCYQKKFTQKAVFGPTLKIGAGGQHARVQKKTCAMMTEFMREVLHSRGV